MKRLFLMAAIACAALISGAENLSWKQHKQLFVEGQITDSEGTLWEVRFIPGVRDITEDAGQSFRVAWDHIAELGDKDFWLDISDVMSSGFRFSKEVFVDHWAKGMGRDFNRLKEDYGSLEPGDFGNGFLRVWFPIKFAGKVVARTIWMPIGVTAGAAYGLVYPPVRIAYQPVSAALIAVTGGVALPGILYVWNGSAWVATYFNDVPERETRWVYIVHQRDDDKEREPVTLVIDMVGFEAIVRASVITNLTDAQTAELQKQINQKQQQIDAIHNEQRQLADQKHEKQSELQNNPDYQARRSLVRQAANADNVNLSQDAESVLLDMDSLRQLVRNYLVASGVEPTTEQVNVIADQIVENIRAMLKHKELTMP